MDLDERQKSLDASLAKLLKKSKSARKSPYSLPDIVARLTRVERRLLAIEKPIKAKK